jgi:hypothetical protein
MHPETENYEDPSDSVMPVNIEGYPVNSVTGQLVGTINEVAVSALR